MKTAAAPFQLLKFTGPSSTTSPKQQVLSPLLAKCERLQLRNAKLGAVIERLVDDMLDELEGEKGGA